MPAAFSDIEMIKKTVGGTAPAVPSRIFRIKLSVKGATDKSKYRYSRKASIASAPSMRIAIAKILCLTILTTFHVKVRNPFFTTKISKEGTGLGLSISNKIIRDHGGNVEIDSIEKESTEILVYLTAANSHSRQ
jgi:K+-sensing histidine kinase KdpD